jgi:hypothetical protein
VTDKERIATLLRQGFSAIAIAAILNTDLATIDAVQVGDGELPDSGGGGGVEPGPWHAFAHTGPGPGTWWNGFTDAPETPVLYRRTGDLIEMTGIASGGTASPGNAIVAFPVDILPSGDVYFDEADLRVHIIEGVAYLVVIDGDGAPYDLSVVSFLAPEE